MKIVQNEQKGEFHRIIHKKTTIGSSFTDFSFLLKFYQKNLLSEKKFIRQSELKLLDVLIYWIKRIKI